MKITHSPVVVHILYVSTIARFALGALAAILCLLASGPARSQPAAPSAAHSAATLAAGSAPSAPASPPATATAPYHLGAHAEIDLGTLLVLKQGAAFAGGIVWGPFRAGLSYATFLSNGSFGGVPDGFTMRANYIVGVNAAYFIGQSSDKGLYIQAMFHIKQQGVTNDATGDHKDLNALATGFELGYVWKLYQGLYVAPRIGALYYVKRPQGSNNDPVRIGDRTYDNPRHKVFDTYFIPTLSLGYSW